VKAEVERIVAGVPQVQSVYNELAVGPVTSFSTRSNDSYITSRVKGRFVDSGKFNAIHVKVVTEDGVVYLLGLVTQSEADSAIQVARTTSGVKKVVNAAGSHFRSEGQRARRAPARTHPADDATGERWLRSLPAGAHRSGSDDIAALRRAPTSEIEPLPHPPCWLGPRLSASQSAVPLSFSPSARAMSIPPRAP
jgi:hypothetical protein